MLPADALDAPCGKPENLPLVDAAFTRPGGPEARRLATNVCPQCPLGLACLSEAMERREPGVWGGTTPNLRTRRRRQLATTHPGTP